MEDSMRLKKEFEEMQKEEVKFRFLLLIQMSLVSATKESEDHVAKGQHARAQLQLWDSLTEMRIRMQVWVFHHSA
jgi:hypothetical protein